MASGVRELLVRFGGRTDPSLGRSAGDASKAIDGVASSAEKTSQRTDGAWGLISAGAAKMVGPLAAAAAGGKLVGTLTDSVAIASDLNEAGTKMTAIFGEQGAGAIAKFAEGGPRALGQTKLAAEDAAATFGVFGKSAGLTGDKLSGFATQFTTLSTDLASFNNSSPEEAVEAIGAALRGEAEPMRRYGVLLDDATMRQEALRLGIVKSTQDALTPQQKVLAAQAVIMKQTKDAQGDFARTSGGLANQQRILSATWADAKGKLGAGLLPMVTKGVTLLNDGLGPAMDKASAAARVLSGVWSQARAQMSPFFADITGMGAAAADVFQTRILPAIDGVVRQVGGIVADGLGVVSEVVRRVGQVVTFVWDQWGAGFLKVTGEVFTGVMRVVQGGLDVVQGIVRTVGAVMRGDWSGAMAGIRQVSSGAMDIVKGIFRIGMAVIGGILRAGAGVAAGVWRGMRDYAVARAGELKDGVVAKIDGARDGVVAAARRVKDGAVGVFSGMRSAVSSAIGDLTGTMSGPMRTAADWLNRNILSPMSSVTSKFGVTLPQIPKFHTGGMVPGQGELLALLMGREGVLTEKGVATIGGPAALERANAGQPIGGHGPVGGIGLGKGWDWIKDQAGIAERVAQRGANKVINELFDLAGGLGQNFPPPMAGQLLAGMVDKMRSAATSWGAKQDEEAAAVTGSLPAGAVGAGRAWPTTLRTLSGSYAGHSGIDIPVRTGTPLYAAANGVIDYVGPGRGYGNAIFGRFNGMPAVYGHGSQSFVRAGQVVQAGQVLGLSGWSGNVRPAGPAGAHLHFEVAPGGAFARASNRDATLRWLGYDQGGALQPGLSAIVNASGKPEAILTASQWESQRRQADELGQLVVVLAELVQALQGGRGDVVVDGHSLRSALRQEIRAVAPTERRVLA